MKHPTSRPTHPLPPTMRPLPPDPQHVSSMHGILVESLGSAIALGQVSGTLDLAEIAEHFGVSRSLIREALRTLSAKGMVVARQKSGTKVTDPSQWAALDEHVIRWRAAGTARFKQLRDSLEIRERIEPLAARRMAQTRDPDAVQELLTATAQLDSAIQLRDTLRMLRADTAFHRALYHGSGNDFLREMSGTVHACLRIPDFQRFDQFSTSSARRHRALATAVADGDADQAESLCNAAMVKTRELFTAAFETLRAEAVRPSASPRPRPT